MDIERYRVYARRNEKEKWSEWSHVNTVEEAFTQGDNIAKFGWMFQIIDRKTKAVIHKND